MKWYLNMTRCLTRNMPKAQRTLERTNWPRQNGASTAASLYALLRIRNRVKTKDAHFVQEYWKQLFSFSFLSFFYFLFSLFWFFWFGLVHLECRLAQDLIWSALDDGRHGTWFGSPRMLVGTRLHLVRLGCWLAHDFIWFASDAGWHRISSDSSWMLIDTWLHLVCLGCRLAQDFIWFALDVSWHKT